MGGRGSGIAKRKSFGSGIDFPKRAREIKRFFTDLREELLHCSIVVPKGVPKAQRGGTEKSGGSRRRLGVGDAPDSVFSVILCCPPSLRDKHFRPNIHNDGALPRSLRYPGTEFFLRFAVADQEMDTGQF